MKLNNHLAIKDCSNKSPREQSISITSTNPGGGDLWPRCCQWWLCQDEWRLKCFTPFLRWTIDKVEAYLPQVFELHFFFTPLCRLWVSGRFVQFRVRKSRWEVRRRGRGRGERVTGSPCEQVSVCSNSCWPLLAYFSCTKLSVHIQNNGKKNAQRKGKMGRHPHRNSAVLWFVLSFVDTVLFTFSSMWEEYKYKAWDTALW